MATLHDSGSLGAGPLERFLAHSPAAHAILDHAGTVLYLSPSFQRVFGYTIDDIPHIAAWWPLAYPDPAYRADRQSTWEALIAEQFPRGGETHNFEGRVRCKQGGDVWVEAHAGFSASEVFISLVDISERKRAVDELRETEAASQALRASEQRFHDIAAASADWIWEIDAAGCYTFVSGSVERTLGYAPEELLGKSPFDFMPAEEAARIGPLFAAIAARAEAFRELENVNLHRDGTRRHVLTNGVPILGAQGELLGYRGVDRDITVRKQAEEQANILAAAVRQSPNSVIVTDAKSCITFVNDAFTAITGFRADEVVGQSANILGSETTPPSTLVSLQQALAAGQPWQGEFHNRRRSGRIGIDNCHIAPVRDKAGQLTHFVGVQEDITEHRRVTAELERYRHHLEELVAHRTEALASAEFRLRTIIESSPDGIIELDAEGNIVMLNPEAERLLDFPAEVLVGLSMHATLHHRTEQGDLHPVSACPIHRGIHSGQAVRVMHDVFWRADGTKLPVSYAMHPILRHGVVTGAVVSFSYNTIRQQAEQAREEARRAAEHLARVKSDFLANMSHEIRTPLNGVLGLAQIGYRENAGRDRAQESFARILDSGKLLLRIINDILDFSKIEAGKLDIESIAFSPARIVDDALAVVSESARAKGLALAIAPGLNLPAAVLGDPVRLSQILINFLSNAVKFTTQGSVTLSAGIDGERLVFAIADTGIGMSVEQLERLFVPFEQADTSTTRRFGGTGLGLSISKRLAGLMGGDIKVASREGVGTTFALHLPYRPANAAAVVSDKGAATPESPTARQRLVGLRILAAEDNEINSIVMKEMLEGEGAVVSLVENGELAVAAVRNGPADFDVALIDVQMPVMDGREATRLIRVIAPRLPVIGQTAHAIAAEHEKCHAAGMVDTLTKPLDLDELVAAVLRHASRTVLGSGDEPPVATLKDSNKDSDSATVIDWPRLRAIHAKRPAFLTKLMGIAVESHGQVASQLRAAAAQADHEAVGRIAHGLKGAAGHFCAGPLEAQARRVEQAVRQADPETAVLAAALAGLVDDFVAEIRRQLD